MEQRRSFSTLMRMKMLDALTEASSVGVKRCIQGYYLLLMGSGECKPVGGCQYGLRTKLAEGYGLHKGWNNRARTLLFE